VAEPAAGHRPLPSSDVADADRLLILGLGNPLMADDGIGHEVIARLERRGLPDSIRLAAVDGDVLALLDLWRGEPAVWLVDAISGGRPPGSMRVFEHRDLLELPAGDHWGHHPSLGESLRWMLHARPEMRAIELRLFGIEVAAVRPEPGLSDATMQSLEPQVEKIAALVRGRQGCRPSHSFTA
jgi:hydrogenase maturation protease